MLEDYIVSRKMLELIDFKSPLTEFHQGRVEYLEPILKTHLPDLFKKGEGDDT